MNIDKNIKSGLLIKDIKRLIEGIIIKTINNFNDENFKIHVEYKRFKGDDKPFFIEYDKEEISKYVFPLISNNQQKKQTFFLTVGRLKEQLKKTKLPDDCLIMIEQINKNDKTDIFKTEDILKDGKIVDFGCEYIKSSGCSGSEKELKFFINYNF